MKPIENYIDQRQIRWAGHVARMSWDRLPRKMLTSWCYSKRPKGAPKMTYGRSLNKAFKRNNFNSTVWMDDAQDRSSWREKIGSI